MPQRQSPPRQLQHRAARQAEFVTCDLTIEHTFRFVKQTLGWTTPRVRHPEQADRWTWLVLAAYTQVRLARACVGDRRLPWERPLPAGARTPYRVRRARSALLLALGTPANPPQPCGRSPGRPKGRRSAPAPRYPAINRTACAPQPRRPHNFLARSALPGQRPWLNHKYRYSSKSTSIWSRISPSLGRTPAATTRTSARSPCECMVAIS